MIPSTYNFLVLGLTYPVIFFGFWGSKKSAPHLGSKNTWNPWILSFSRVPSAHSFRNSMPSEFTKVKRCDQFIMKKNASVIGRQILSIYIPKRWSNKRHLNTTHPNFFHPWTYKFVHFLLGKTFFSWIIFNDYKISAATKATTEPCNELLVGSKPGP